MVYKNITNEDAVLTVDDHFLSPEETLARFVGLIEIERLNKLPDSEKNDMEARFELLIDLWSELLVELPQELLDLNIEKI